LAACRRICAPSGRGGGAPPPPRHPHAATTLPPHPAPTPPAPPQVLNASRNALTVVPGELAALSRLVDLDLSRNDIALLQPRACSGLPALKFLNLMGNRLAGGRWLCGSVAPGPLFALRCGGGRGGCCGTSHATAAAAGLPS
jgi:hypothetical protein